MRILELLFLTMRPQRWWRIAVIFTPLLFSGNIFQPIFILKICVGFIIFCLLTGAINIIDDIKDINLDRQDAAKRTYPIASSELGISEAEFALGIILAGSFVSAFLLGPAFGAISLLYFFICLSYFLFLKKIIILDALVIGAESVVCLLAGSAAIYKPLSPWLTVIVFFIALLLVLCEKRRAQALLKIKGEKSLSPELYDEKLLDQLINITAPFILISYTIYSLISIDGIRFNLFYTIPLIIYGIYRIFYLSYSVRTDITLEKLLLKDVFLMADIGIWALIMIILTSI